MDWKHSAASAAAYVSFPAVAHAQAPSCAEVEAMLKGKTMIVEDFGSTGAILWNADMTIAVDVTKPDGSKIVDTGTYRFDGAGYCSTWAILRTTEKYFTLEKTSDTTWNIQNLDGSLVPKLTAQ